MRLLEILKEVTVIQEQQVLTEANRKQIKEKFGMRGKKYEGWLNSVSKGKLPWTKDELTETRNALIATMVGKTPDKKAALKLLLGPDSEKVIVILQALETAHGGRDVLLRKAGKNKVLMQELLEEMDAILNNEDDAQDGKKEDK